MSQLKIIKQDQSKTKLYTLGLTRDFIDRYISIEDFVRIYNEDYWYFLTPCNSIDQIWKDQDYEVIEYLIERNETDAIVAAIKTGNILKLCLRALHSWVDEIRSYLISDGIVEQTNV